METNSHNLHLSFNKAIAAAFAVTISTNIAITRFVNPDRDNYELNQVAAYRHNTLLGLETRLDYSLAKDISFFSVVNWTRNYSNLPPKVFSSLDRQSGRASNESSLTDATARVVTLGSFVDKSIRLGVRLAF